jgi:hypothetical protein
MDFAKLRRRSLEVFGRVPVFVRPLLLVVMPVVLLHPLWTAGMEDEGARERPMTVATTTRAPDFLETVRVHEAIERHPAFSETKKAILPRRLSDHGDRDRYPAIHALVTLGYITVTEDSSLGTIDLVIESTPDGRLQLMEDLREDATHYVVSLARREYLPDTEHVNIDRTTADKASVQFKWRWQATNKAGEALDRVSNPSSWDNEARFRGVATFTRARGEWRLDHIDWHDESVDLMKRQ